MNKKILSICILICSWFTIYGQDKVYFQTNFDNGIPQDFILLDNDEAPLKAGIYQNIILNGSWAANTIDTKANKAAFSLSRYNYEFISENWMITPSIQISSENAYLRWDAKSVHYDYREDYKVMISTTDIHSDSFKELYSVDKESYSWKTYTLSLADYAGKDVHIAFVGTSNNQFILAIDNLFIGEISEVAFDTTDESGRFSGDTGTAPVKGTIRNTGKTVSIKNINCITPQDTYSMAYNDSPIQPNEEFEFNFHIPVTVNKVSQYKLEVELENGAIYTLHEDSIICSYYPRTMLIEKATACWCNSCPNGNLVSNRLKDRLKNEAIIIEIHSNDPLKCNPYVIGITRWLQSYPSFIYNRESGTAQTNMLDNSIVKKALLSPTTAKVDVEVERGKTDKALLNISTQTEFALDYDNTNGLYKLGYAIVEKSIQGFVQANNSTLLSNGEFYYLPNSIPVDIHVYHNVGREGSTAFKGVTNSLPPQLVAKKPYSFTHSLAIPEEFTDSNNLMLVVFVMNTITGAVLNTAYTDIPSATTSMYGPFQSNEENITVSRSEEGTYRIHLIEADAPYNIELIAPNGKIVEKKNGIAESQFITIGNLPFKGCYLLKVSQPNISVTQKIILY